MQSPDPPPLPPPNVMRKADAQGSVTRTIPVVGVVTTGFLEHDRDNQCSTSACCSSWSSSSSSTSSSSSSSSPTSFASATGGATAVENPRKRQALCAGEAQHQHSPIAVAANPIAPMSMPFFSVGVPVDNMQQFVYGQDSRIMNPNASVMPGYRHVYSGINVHSAHLPPAMQQKHMELKAALKTLDEEQHLRHEFQRDTGVRHERHL